MPSRGSGVPPGDEARTATMNGGSTTGDVASRRHPLDQHRARRLRLPLLEELPMDTSDERHARGANDDRLGMNEPITRRDFVNAALVAGGGLWLHGRMPAGPTGSGTTADAWTGYGGVGDYARSNGNTFDVMNAAHAIRDRTFESKLAEAIDTGEMYDLLVVGGGISGLASAVFFQKRKGGRCLVLDNHPIFGGEAKRNEFLVDGQS